MTPIYGQCIALRRGSGVSFRLLRIVNRGGGAGTDDHLRQLARQPKRGSLGSDLRGTMAPNEGFSNDSAGTWHKVVIMHRLGVHPERKSFHVATGKQRQQLGRAEGAIDCRREAREQPHQLVNIVTRCDPYGNSPIGSLDRMHAPP